MKNRAVKEGFERRRDGGRGRLLVLTGARQVGKTTLVRRLCPDYTYISCDDPTLRPQLLALSVNDWILRYPKVILDEVQKAPALFDTVKAIYDQSPESRQVLLGSSQILLLEKVRESLAGRAAILELFPMTLPELLAEGWETPVLPSRWISYLADPQHDLKRFAGIPALSPEYSRATLAWERFLAVGGMPALWSTPTLEADECREWLRDYVRTYLQRDIRDLAALRELEPFVLAQRAVAAQSGGLLNLSDLARTAGIAPSTAQRFLRYLEISYQTLSLPPWFRNPAKRLAKTPKLHLLDPGIGRAILGKWGDLSGLEFESAVVAELYKQLRSWNQEATCHHLRTMDGREVDLLVELEDGYVAVEVKQSAKVSLRDARHFGGLADILDKPLLQAFVLSNDPVPRALAPGITALPVAWALAP